MSGAESQNSLSVEDLRGVVDMLDGEIRRLVESRVEIAIQIIEQKEHVRDEGREADILSGCETQLQRDVQRRLIEESIRRADE